MWHLAVLAWSCPRCGGGGWGRLGAGRGNHDEDTLLGCGTTTGWLVFWCLSARVGPLGGLAWVGVVGCVRTV